MSNTKTIKLTSAQKEVVLGDLTVSHKIRYLNREGFTRAQIAQILKKRYQHVRNVLVEDERLGRHQAQ